MQRQSLSSPVSKLHSHGGGGAKDQNLDADDDSRKDLLASSSSLADYEEECKSTKLRRLSTPSSSRSDKLIHLIPILTFMCFLILYLCSHDASDLDLVQFNGLKRLSKNIDSTEMNDIGRFIDLRRSDVLAIRSLKNLGEIGEGTRKSRPHRKIPDF